MTSVYRAVPAVARAVLILDLVAARSQTVSLEEIARTLRLPKSSSLAICRTLVHEGLLVRDSGGGYRTGLRLATLARRHLQGHPITDAFTEILDVHPELSETAQLAVLDGHDVIYLARRDGSHPVRLASNIGHRLPASTTATGKAILAGLTDDGVRAVYAGVAEWPRLTSQSVTSLDALLETLHAVRDRGYAVDDEETMEGVVCFGAALFADESPNPVGAISITVLKARLSIDRRDQVAACIRMIAEEMTVLLGGSGRQDRHSQD